MRWIDGELMMRRQEGGQHRNGLDAARQASRGQGECGRAGGVPAPANSPAISSLVPEVTGRTAARLQLAAVVFTLAESIAIAGPARSRPVATLAGPAAAISGALLAIGLTIPVTAAAPGSWGLLAIAAASAAVSAAALAAGRSAGRLRAAAGPGRRPAHPGTCPGQDEPGRRGRGRDAGRHCPDRRARRPGWPGPAEPAVRRLVRLRPGRAGRRRRGAARLGWRAGRDGRSGAGWPGVLADAGPPAAAVPDAGAGGRAGRRPGSRPARCPPPRT